MFPFSSLQHETLHATEHASSASPSLCLTLHLLADLDVNLKELGDAAVETDALALVEIGLAVRCIDTFCGARFEESAK